MSRIKYSPVDKRELAAFESLCKRVDRLDSGAAKYLRRLGRNWDPVTFRSCGIDGFYPDACLSKCFVWSELPQGHRFWNAIDKRMEAGEA